MTASVAHGAPAPARLTSLRLAAGCAGVAALVHLAVLPEHAREWWLYGGFFLVVACSQLLLAALLLHGPSPRTVIAGIGGTVLLVYVYVGSRTVGLPLTPPAHTHTVAHLPTAGGVGNGVPVLPQQLDPHVEQVGGLDLTALAAELVLVAVLVGLLPAAARRVTTNAMLAAGLLAWTLFGALALR
jgi:hypothetical protein